MVSKAENNNLTLRPHFKTHQSLIIGDWFKKFGINSITVSSIKMAKYFAENGWNDITVAFPVNIREIAEINKLAQKINLNILITSDTIIQFLNDNLKMTVGVFIKIDTGYHRSGIEVEETDAIDNLINKIELSKVLSFKGFLTHDGHTYHAKSVEEINDIHNLTIKKLSKLKKRYINKYKNIIISIGDTPSCSISNNFTDIDEIRPGNFVFYDFMQANLGSCSINKIAVALACPVVDINAKRNEIVIYGGAVHLSKEFIMDSNNNKNFGLVVEFLNNGWSEPINGTYLYSLSQEHGIIKTTKNFLSKIKIGDIVGILPVHSCLTANLMKSYTSFENIEIDHL
ncbi:MAG: alanine racemase [Bacteroidetes bacterium]|nr:alanine racemase [Bacteroidota bacterium]